MLAHLFGLRRSRRPTDAPTALVDPAAAPAKLGRYLVEREIGRGAMGAVYLAHDPDGGNAVAIKTMALAREFEGEALDEARERFFREARAAGRIDHPGVVRIFDAGQTGELAYIAMEFAPGHDLSHHTQPGQLLSLSQATHIGACVAEALAHAHRQGVVHRDVKPANLMFDAATSAVKITDFGVARVADASRTRTGLVLGSPSYMAPEQLIGQRVDGRSDLYALGVVLFQLLSGSLPHASDSMAVLMRQIVNDLAPDVRTLRADVPDPLARVLARMLEKNPNARYADGDLVATDLRRAGLELTVVGGPNPELDASDPRHNS